MMALATRIAAHMESAPPYTADKERHVEWSGEAYSLLDEALSAIRGQTAIVDDGAISTLLDDALSAMSRCEHDGGFDREIGPIGCSLNDKCVCIGVYPLVAKARAIAKATA